MKIMISAGEASGDMHAAKALQKLVTTNSAPIEAFGMGGNHLAAQGMELIINNEHHSVMGLVEVLKKYPLLRSNLNTLKQTLQERKPDVLLLVDYPHFNMKLAATAKSLGIPVVYFIAPKVWASRRGRLKELSGIVDHMAVILPFEVSIFEEAGIPTTYVGNPLLDNTELSNAGASNTQPSPTPRVALMPGSRKSEIKYLLQPMLEASALLKDKHPAIQFVLPVAETIDRHQIQEILNQQSELSVSLISSDDYKTLSTCDAAMVASGTATLELAILGLPMTVAYRLNRLSYAVVKRWITIEHISLVNIIAGFEAVPELLQDQVSASALFEHTNRLLSDVAVCEKQKADLELVHLKLGNAGATAKLCELLQSVVEKHQSIITPT